MKGVILCGGMGTRLDPLTRVTNKHLLPVGGEPMIFHALRFLAESGIREVMLVTGGNNAGDFLTILGDGAKFGLDNLAYTYQPQAAGIADALGRAERWIDGHHVCVLLGDNVFERPQLTIRNFPRRGEQARIFWTVVDHPEHYGVVQLGTNDLSVVVEIEEKPVRPVSDRIAVGLYLYDASVWDRIRTLCPSGRGELEITDLNRSYLRGGQLGALPVEGWWVDCGESIDGYVQASQKVHAARQGAGR